MAIVVDIDDWSVRISMVSDVAMAMWYASGEMTEVTEEEAARIKKVLSLHKDHSVDNTTFRREVDTILKDK